MELQNLLLSRSVPFAALWKFAEDLIAACQHRSVWLFEGGLGAGKTTCIQRVAQLMGVQDSVSSPTFSLVHEYSLPNGNLLYHIDLYRLGTARELQEIGIFELINSQDYCFIEWAAIAIPLLEVPFVTIKISSLPNGERLFEVYDSE